MYGIDVSSNQPRTIVMDVPNDFAIVKMSGNPQSYRWDYVNEDAERQAGDAMARHGLLGLYHFTWGLDDPAIEAAFFVDNVRKLGYIGRAMLVIDYEAQAVNRGRDWVSALARKVEELAGYAPVIYASGSVIVEQGLKSLGYPIWVSNYYKGYEPIWGYDTGGCIIYRGCEDSILWQYTSQGFLPGYDGPLDCNVFQGARWSDYTGKEVKMLKLGLVAVQVMRHLCECPLHGYSQPGRYGTSGYCDVATDAGVKKVKRGDRDCSSATAEAWERALEGTPFEGMIRSWLATYTMKEAFLATGLFEWKPMSFMAEPGDLYLNEDQHVAMCLQNDGEADVLAEFYIAETGDIDGEPGDQTGWESRIVGYYDFPWDGILHYNGGADEVAPPDAWGVCMWGSHGGANQRFRRDDGEGGFMLICEADGRALDVSGGEALCGASVILYTPHGKPNQRWNLSAKDDGTFEIVSALDSSLCLDVMGSDQSDGAGLCVWERNGGANQAWVLLPNPDGSITVMNNGWRKMVLDCVGGGK